MKDQIKFIEKSIPNLQQMGMQFMSMGTQEELREQIINKALDIACLQDPLPIDAASFAKRKDEGKSRLVLLVNEIARLLSQVLTEFHGLPKRLQGLPQQTAQDMQQQLQGLVHKRFLLENDYSQLSHFPRYLKAMNVRMEKLRGDPSRDAKLMAEWQQAAAAYLRATRENRPARTPIRNGGVPLDAGGIARILVCTRAAHADAGISQALAESLGVHATLSGLPHAGRSGFQVDYFATGGVAMARTGKLLRSLIRAGTRTAKLFAAAATPPKPKRAAAKPRARLAAAKPAAAKPASKRTATLHAPRKAAPSAAASPAVAPGKITDCP